MQEPQIKIVKAKVGWEYRITSDGRLVATGWSAGSRADALAEAKSHSAEVAAE